MRRLPQQPILYLITRGATTNTTLPSSTEFRAILDQISAAVAAGFQLVQLREKRLTDRALFELATAVVGLTQGSSTRLLVNDRADIAVAAGAHGVHLTTNSIRPEVMRETFGEDFLIGASTHSLVEATAARDGGADFAVYGPVFETASKAEYGSPVGLKSLAQVTRAVEPFPILALGGVSQENAQVCLNAGARGIAGISIFSDIAGLAKTVNAIRESI